MLSGSKYLSIYKYCYLLLLLRVLLLNILLILLSPGGSFLLNGSFSRSFSRSFGPFTCRSFRPTGNRPVSVHLSVEPTVG